MKKKSVLLVGSTGFLGNAVLAECLQAGIEPTLLNRSEHKGYFGKQVPLGDLDKIPDFYDAVINLAACIPYKAMDEFSAELLEVNAILPYRLARTFISAHHVYASSVSVYAMNNSLPIEESSLTVPGNVYGASKLAGECLASIVPKSTILRFSSLYGPGMTTATFLPMVLEAAKNGKELTLYGDGQRKQDYLHVRDAARMVVATVVDPHPGIYNAVSGIPVTNLQLAQAVADIMPRLRINFRGTDPSPSQFYSVRKFHSTFSVAPIVSLRAGLEEMLRNYE